MSFASNPTAPLANELDILMSCYMDETNAMELDPEESFSPDTFWDDGNETDNFDGNGSFAMDFLPSQNVDGMHGIDSCSYSTLTTNDAFSSTSSFFYDPNDTSTHHDKETIAQKLRDLDQKLAASMKRSEASRARILELKQHRLTKSSTNISTSITTSPFGGIVQSMPSVTPTASPNHSQTSSMSNDVVSDADKTAVFLVESRTSLTAALEQSRLQLSRFSTSALSA